MRHGRRQTDFREFVSAAVGAEQCSKETSSRSAEDTMPAANKEMQLLSDSSHVSSGLLLDGSVAAAVNHDTWVLSSRALAQVRRNPVGSVEAPLTVMTSIADEQQKQLEVNQSFLQKLGVLPSTSKLNVEETFTTIGGSEEDASSRKVQENPVTSESAKQATLEDVEGTKAKSVSSGAAVRQKKRAQATFKPASPEVVAVAVPPMMLSPLPSLCSRGGSRDDTELAFLRRGLDSKSSIGGDSEGAAACSPLQHSASSPVFLRVLPREVGGNSSADLPDFTLGTAMHAHTETGKFQIPDKNPAPSHDDDGPLRTGPGYLPTKSTKDVINNAIISTGHTGTARRTSTSNSTTSHAPPIVVSADALCSVLFSPQQLMHESSGDFSKNVLRESGFGKKHDQRHERVLAPPSPGHRVVYVRRQARIPFGRSGTVTAIYFHNREDRTVDVLFDLPGFGFDVTQRIANVPAQDVVATSPAHDFSQASQTTSARNESVLGGGGGRPFHPTFGFLGGKNATLSSLSTTGAALSSPSTDPRVTLSSLGFGESVTLGRVRDVRRARHADLGFFEAAVLKTAPSENRSSMLNHPVLRIKHKQQSRIKQDGRLRKENAEKAGGEVQHEVIKHKKSASKENSKENSREHLVNVQSETTSSAENADAGAATKRAPYRDGREERIRIKQNHRGPRFLAPDDNEDDDKKENDKHIKTEPGPVQAETLNERTTREENNTSTAAKGNKVSTKGSDAPMERSEGKNKKDEAEQKGKKRSTYNAKNKGGKDRKSSKGKGWERSSGKAATNGS
ncbi:unnamed protein product [Amoebophrya sp. A25]|nr:unnamed protein product [Amoebophrya sp. A25]|eukprot:GSA25T00023570001.1